MKKYLLAPLSAMLSAVLLVLAFPRWSFSFLAAVALAPLLAAVAREPRPLGRFLLGWICGALYWFGVCYWIQFTLASYRGVGEAGGWALFLLFCAIKALHMAVFALVAGVFLGRWWAVPGIAALWVAVEWSHNFLGFAWLALGNAGISMSVPLRLAPYTGVYGLSFVFVMMNAALAVATLRRARLEMAWLAGLPFLLLLPHFGPPERARESAVLVQPNISTTQDWTSASVDRMQRELVRVSLATVKAPAPGPPPSLIVWPEMPAPIYYEEDARLRELVGELARAANAHVLLGAVAHRADGAPLNSAVLVSRSGAPVSRYDKINLVPFGEFVPWPFAGITQKISTEAGDFAPGTRLVVSRVDGHGLGAFICYESVFPHFVRRFAAGGAEVLFNLSNDGFFGRSAARGQHLDIARMRAVENRRWLLRATNDGITATIDPAGRLRGTLPADIEAGSRTGFTYISGQTFYTRHGDWFPVSCALAAAALLGLELRPRRAA